ncbi:hypothetical protein C8R41DRAFT_742788, partial [Lentinula lateritia]
IQRLGQHSVVLTADFTDEDQAKNLVEDTTKLLGGLDVVSSLFSNKPLSHSSTATTESWNRIFDVNARGHFFCYKYAAQQMISQRKGGRI